MTESRKTVCLDFDGVLHAYSQGWADGTIYDVPMFGALPAVMSLVLEHRLVISSCREDKEGIWVWLDKHGLAPYIDEVTNSKPIASVYIDDRAVRFTGSWLEALAEVRELMDGTPAISGPGAGRGGGG